MPLAEEVVLILKAEMFHSAAAVAFTKMTHTRHKTIVIVLGVNKLNVEK